MRAGGALLLVLAGCGTTQLEYAGPRPKVATVQWYPALTQQPGVPDIHHFAQTMEIEAGCIQATLGIGQTMSVWRGKTFTETGTAITYLNDSIDPQQVARSSGADAIFSGHARLTPRSLRVEEIKLEAKTPDGRVLAQANFSSSDGLEPFAAGEKVCGELFRGWGAASPPLPPMAKPTSAYLITSDQPRDEKFREGCKRGAEEIGVTLLPRVEVPGGPGSYWQRLQQATGDQAVILRDMSWPLKEELGVSNTIVWLLDAEGRLRNAKLFHAETSLGDPGAVGEKLCKEALSSR